jgi:hypothetical protein
MIRLLLLAFPPSWRHRYGDELAGLLEDTGVGPRIALDIVRSGLRQRGHAVRRAMRSGGMEMIIGPAWRHPRGWALAAGAIVAPTVLFVTGSLLAYELGIPAVASVMEPVNAWLGAVRPADLLLVLAPAVALAVAAAPLLRVQLHRDGGTEAMIGVRLRRLNLGVALVALLLGGVLAWHVLVETVPQAAA